MYDVCIIGAGVVGSSIARELSKYQVKVAWLEKDSDVSNGTSKANSGIIHGGYDSKYGTLKGKLSAKGNKMFDQLDKELKFGLKRCGSFVLAFDDEDQKEIESLYKNGFKNGVEGIEIVDKEFVLQKEPYINPEVKSALYCKTAGIISPFEFTIALAENAVENGIELFLETEVTNIRKINDIFIVESKDKTFESRYIINASGLFSDEVANMIGIKEFEIKPRRGEYLLLDKDQGHLANSVIFQCPKAGSKGVLVTPTIHNNLMVGPSAEFTDNKEDVDTTIEVLNKVINTGRKSINNFDKKKIITQFSGLRASTLQKDFIIEESKVKNFINVAGIESPGLTSSPAIAIMIIDILFNAKLKLIRKEDFNPYRKPITKVTELTSDEVNKLIEKDFRYGRIICRCESITEGEIIEAIHRPIQAKSLDAIKRRVRAGMGRCQGGFCSPKVMEIISKELNIDINKVNKNEEGSYILGDRTKSSFR